MRKFVIAIAALAISAAPVHAQFEDFAGSEGFAGFNGNTANAGCVSGASGSAMWGMGATGCTATAGGEYQSQNYSVQGGQIEGQVGGGYSNASGYNSSISSVWNANGSGEKTGGNTIGGSNSGNSANGVTYSGSVWGSFEQGSANSFSGSSNVTTNSWFSNAAGAD